MVSGRLRVAATLSVAVFLAGCGDRPRTPPTPHPAGAHTAVTPRQAAMILGAVDAALVRATTARNVTAVDDRAVGPALEALTATIRVQAGLKQSPVAPAAPTKPRLFLTRSQDWPRWFLAAGSTPASASPVLRVLTSSDPRRPYGLWAQLQLLPGAALPEMAPATIGADPLAPTASDLMRTPKEVLARYTEVLNRGDASVYQGDFTPDAYRNELNEQLAYDRGLVSSSRAGTVTALHKVALVGPFALPTSDGGALVIGRIDQRYQIAVAAGGKDIHLDSSLAALLGRQLVSHHLDRWSVEVLAFHVPQTGSSSKITLVAASRTDVAAVGT